MKPRPAAQLTLAMAVGTIAAVTVASTPPNPALSLLLIHSNGHYTKDMRDGPNNGRSIPWPRVQHTRESINKLSSQEAQSESGKPEMTHEADEGSPITLSSGLGLWARAIEAAWTKSGRIIWQHVANRPDWTDWKWKDKIRIEPNYDLTLTSPSRKEEGQYTSRFRLTNGGPVYVMDTAVKVKHHPQPVLLVNGSEKVNRRIEWPANQTGTVIKCKASSGDPKILLYWEQDGHRTAPGKTRIITTNDTTTIEMDLSQPDNGAIITCVAQNNDTATRKTVSATVRAPSGSKEQAEQEGPRTPHMTRKNFKSNRLTARQTRTPTWHGIPFPALYLIAAIAATLLIIGLTIATISICQHGTWDPNRSPLQPSSVTSSTRYHNV